MGLWRFFRRCLSASQQFCFAFFLSRFSIVYNRVFNDRKEQLFSSLHTMTEQKKRPIELLEIGAGTGTNFKYYPSGCHVTCLDPNSHMIPYSRKERSGLVIKEPVVGFAENMLGVVDNSVDVVVSTIVMCSVSDVDKSLAEIRRILRPGGKFLYLEHVIYPRMSLMRIIQILFRPIWSFLFDGCDITRDLATSIEKAGFSHVTQEQFLIPYKRIDDLIAATPLMRPHVMGCATK